ncbi:MAG: FtsX-like permease family protein, partial [Bacteroidetes bacterium]
ETRTTLIFQTVSVLAIALACLGLLGLSAFAVEQRSKEIGIRKVLGATVPQILLLLSGEFLRLILLAFVLALPLAWWATYRWLEDFAYRIPLHAGFFALAGLSVLLMALLTVSVQTIRAALSNPAQRLRTE